MLNHAQREITQNGISMGFSGSSVIKNMPSNVGDAGDTSLILGSGRSPGRGNDDLFQYSCLKKSHGQRSLAGYSPWDLKESQLSN